MKSLTISDITLYSYPSPSLPCNEWGHLNRIYDILKTWLLRIWELFIRLKHHLSYGECCFGGNKWFCCSFSNELLFIHSLNVPFVCIYVRAKAVIKGNEARVTTHNQVFFIMHRATTELKYQLRMQMIENTYTHCVTPQLLLKQRVHCSDLTVALRC